MGSIRLALLHPGSETIVAAVAPNLRNWRRLVIAKGDMDKFRSFLGDRDQTSSNPLEASPNFGRRTFILSIIDR